METRGGLGGVCPARHAFAERSEDSDEVGPTELHAMLDLASGHMVNPRQEGDSRSPSFLIARVACLSGAVSSRGSRSRSGGEKP